MADELERDTAAPKSGATPRGQRVLRVGLVIMTLVVLVDAVMGDKGVFALMRAREERQGLETQVTTKRVENQHLIERIRLIREDLPTIEDLARRDLGMIKPGETLFIIRDLPAAQPR